MSLRSFWEASAIWKNDIFGTKMDTQYISEENYCLFERNHGKYIVPLKGAIRSWFIQSFKKWTKNIFEV